MTEQLLFDSWLTFLDALVWKEELDQKNKQTNKQNKSKQLQNKRAVFTLLTP